MNPEQRILVHTPTGRDAALIGDALTQAGVGVHICQTWDEVEREITVGAAGVVVSEEGLHPTRAAHLHELLETQPVWSDLPILLLMGRSVDSAAIHAAARAIGNVTLLERPMRMASLLSAVENAKRARQRQYESRRQLLALERAANDLSASEHQLREAHARKDEFLATLAHELRNPLAPIRNAMHVLRRKSTDPNLGTLHDIVDRQMQQMVRLVDDLLEVSRITRGKVNLQIERVDISSVIRGAIETSRPLIDNGRHELVVELPADAIHVDGDPVRLGQVFANLLNNAAKYTEDGGRIEMRASVEGDEVRVSVSDSGIGIAPEMLSSVFDIFTQVRDANTRAQGGLGIGLTLVRSLVELHGGYVSARSDGVGKGSEFTVTLPLAAAESAGQAANGATHAAPRHISKRVIIVDDNRDAADTLAMVLRQHGAEVQTTYSATDVLRLLSPHSRMTVIADLGMPELDGFELARRIRADAANAQVQLIALSGWGQNEDRTKAHEAGFEAHFTKPADVDALIALLATHR